VSPRRLVLALALAFAAAATGAARADVVKLKDGGAIEGKVVSEDDKGVTIDTPFGRQTIERSRVAGVVKGPTALEELQQKEAALKSSPGGGTAAQWFELSELALAKGLRKERERLLDKTLAVDRDHAGANLARGKVKHDGRWMTPAERDAAVKAAEEARMRERGLVEHQGRWVTPEEKAHLERGDEQVGGKWLSADDAKRARGLVPFAGGWIPASEEVPLRRLALHHERAPKLDLAREHGDHVVVATAFGKEHAKELRDASERGVALAAAAFGEAASDLGWLGGQKLLAVVVPQRDDFALFARTFADDEKKVDQRWAEGVAKVEGFFWWDPTGTSATFLGARDVERTTAHTVHHLGHVLLNRHGFNSKFLPTWLDEGFAAWLEHAVLDANVISCISSVRYESDGVRKDELVSRSTWFDDMRLAISEKRDPPLSTILRRDLTTITPDEVAKSMLVIEHLSRTRHDDFLRFLHALREAWPKGLPGPMSPEATAAHAKAFAALGTPAELLDREVRAAFAAAPPAPKKKTGS
jgi:hypothetical protein